MMSIKTKFKIKNTNEEVEREIWEWEVKYNDGKIIKQFGDDGYFNRFSDLKQEGIVYLKVFSLIFPQSYTLLYEEGMKLVYFYERYCFNYKTENEIKATIYCFGYEKEKEKKVFMIMPNNELVITSDPQSVKLEI